MMIPLLSSSSPKNNGPVIKQENQEQFFEGWTKKAFASLTNQQQEPEPAQ